MERIDDYQMLRLSVIGFGAMSMSFMLMPLSWGAVLAGLIFWGGLIVGVTAQVILAVRARKAGWKSRAGRCGLLTFFSGKWAKAADLTTAAGAVLTGVALAATNGFGYVCYVLLAATVFAFCMHCILNSKILLFAIRQTDTPANTGKNKKQK